MNPDEKTPEVPEEKLSAAAAALQMINNKAPPEPIPGLPSDAGAFTTVDHAFLNSLVDKEEIDNAMSFMGHGDKRFQDPNFEIVKGVKVKDLKTDQEEDTSWMLSTVHEEVEDPSDSDSSSSGSDSDSSSSSSSETPGAAAPPVPTLRSVPIMPMVAPPATAKLEPVDWKESVPSFPRESSLPAFGSFEEPEVVHGWRSHAAANVAMASTVPTSRRPEPAPPQQPPPLRSADRDTSPPRENEGARAYSRRAKWREVNGEEENHDIRIRKTKQGVLRNLQREYGGPEFLRELDLGMHTPLHDLLYHEKKLEEQKREDHAVNHTYRKIAGIGFNLVEKGNKNFIGADLENWGDWMKDELLAYKPALRLIYRKFAARRTSSPISDLTWGIGISLLSYHFQMVATGKAPEHSEVVMNELAQIRERRQKSEGTWKEPRSGSGRSRRHRRHRHGRSSGSESRSSRSYSDSSDSDGDLTPPPEASSRSFSSARKKKKSSGGGLDLASLLGGGDGGGIDIKSILGMVSGFM